MLFCNIDLLDENFECKRGQYVGVKNGKIAYIGDAERLLQRSQPCADDAAARLRGKSAAAALAG